MFGGYLHYLVNNCCLLDAATVLLTTLFYVVIISDNLVWHTCYSLYIC